MTGWESPNKRDCSGYDKVRIPEYGWLRYSEHGWQKNKKRKKNTGNCKALCVPRKRNNYILLSKHIA